MDASTRDLVRRRASDCCEYCRLPQYAAPFISFHVEHIVAVQHGGDDDPENLAWACHRCNAYKGTNLASIDVKSGQIAMLFHPRRDDWHAHFRLAGAKILGLTPIGRATLRLLEFNDSYRVELRDAWLLEESSE